MTLASLLLGASFAVADGPTADEPAVSIEALEAETRERECRRLIGVSFGATQRARSWDYIGDGPIAVAASPSFGLTCAVNTRGVPWELGVATSPLYRTRRMGTVALGRAWWTASFGPLLGTGTWRGGPWVTVGWGRVGGGGRVVHLPWTNEKGIRRGFEGRVEALYNGSLEVMGSALVVFSAKGL